MRAPRPGSVRPLVAASWRRSASVDPDSTPEVTLGTDELDAARAEECELIGALLWRAPTAETLAAL